MIINDHLTGVTGAEIRSFGFQVLASAPTSGNFTGRFYWDSTLGAARWWNGTAWVNKASDSLLLEGVGLSQVRDFAQTTGQRSATSAISDFDTQVRTSRLDQMATPTVAVSLGNQKITNLANGTNPADAVNFSQLEAARQGIRAKAAVEVAMTTNVSVPIPGTAVFDGHTVSSGERILLTGQTTGSENGIYIFNGISAALTRANDADSFEELDAGTETYAQDGTNNKGIWRQTTELTSFSGQTWIKVGGSVTYIAGDGLTEAPTGTFNVGSGTGITVTADAIAIDTTTVARKGSTTLSTSANTYTIPHGLGSADLAAVTVRNTSSGEIEYPRIVVDATNIVITFLVAPSANQYRVSWSG